MEIILTIAVPTYNIENYISRCIQSFMSVNSIYYNDFEILIINDGSKDNSVNVVEELKKESNLNIRIINKENGGHGSAVNRGISEAKGKYFKVIDGDDWINKHDFEEFLQRLKHAESDLIVTNYTEQHTYNGNKVKINVLNKMDGFKSTELTNIFPMHGITYRTKLLHENQIRLTEKIFYVDTQYAIFPMKYVKTWEYWNLDIYQYFLGRPDQSMSLDSRLKNIDHHKIVMESIIEFYKELEENEFKKTLENVVRDLINTRYLLAFLSENSSDLLKETTKYVEENKIDYKFRSDNRTSYLIYFNEKHNRKFSKIINPIVKYKINSLKKRGI